ncbi:MAG TPA: hypothetical protein VFK08_08005 [Rhodanobacteraceae bacterium]|jgi:hypothetical protein|nr:hypothetical protein [Rhodanobacteraceae bacterium]
MQSKALPFALLSALGLGLAASAASAAPQIKCHMDFTLSGWSIIYQTADGTGTVTCDNGTSMPVKIDAKGGGLTVGKYKLTDGRATFSHITDIQQVLGSYATANAHAGVVHSGHAAAMTKGNVSMSLTGQGQGWDIGAGFESFSISKAK